MRRPAARGRARALRKCSGRTIACCEPSPRVDFVACQSRARSRCRPPSPRAHPRPGALAAARSRWRSGRAPPAAVTLLGSARRTAREAENVSLFYMLDERGCAGLVDAGHRGRELVDLLVLRRGGAEVVRAELSDIRVVIICLLRTEQRGSIGGDVREPLCRSPRWRLAGH
eukprot:COSAG04_NODE_12644_length_642_cov_0.902394_1_plen_170_part_10